MMRREDIITTITSTRYPWNGQVDQEFFDLPTHELARRLLGMICVHDTPLGRTAGRIIEVEMYKGPWDKAAHSYGGKMTERTRVMYGPPGHAYVYFIYGMHYCLNVVSGPVGYPEAILIRALEPVEGLDIMAKRRQIRHLGSMRQICQLTNGPGKLAQALGITREHYGLPLYNSPLTLYHDQDPLPSSQIAAGPRINVSYAQEAADFPWRFWIVDHPCLSVKTPAQKTKT
ncbi:DNA-3-methyladenine glycosylase [Sulfobacillus thermosulfidooxidans]|uniref:DNA-3-methyladenine glycosylase n=1 Tax=Sulfobacillus thermosulfidooxidans TaxID=28034 RepID=UPI0009F92195|nr:DNA-3-methyladenine glycosylase [Sulfobacillus thermosulfidooxidans]